MMGHASKKIPVVVLGESPPGSSVLPYVSSVDLRPRGQFILSINNSADSSASTEATFEIHLEGSSEDFTKQENAIARLELLLHQKRKKMAEEISSDLAVSEDQVHEKNEAVETIRDRLCIASALTSYFNLGPEDTMLSYEGCLMASAEVPHERQTLPDMISETARLVIAHKKSRADFRQAWKEYSTKISFSLRSEFVAALDACLEFFWEAEDEAA
jgi:hypothetical protein